MGMHVESLEAVVVMTILIVVTFGIKGLRKTCLSALQSLKQDKTPPYEFD